MHLAGFFRGLNFHCHFTSIFARPPCTRGLDARRDITLWYTADTKTLPNRARKEASEQFRLDASLF